MDPAIDSTTSDASAEIAFVADDREWVELLRSGNVYALEALFRKHVCGMTAFAFRYVPSHDGAIRLVHDVFARLWRARHSWAYYGSVRGTLFAATHRAGIEELHRTHNEGRWHAGLPLPVATDRDWERAERKLLDGLEERSASIHHAIRRLPALTRTVGYMRWADRLSRAEIACVLGTNVRTVHTHIAPASVAMHRQVGLGAATESRRSAPGQSDTPANVNPAPAVDSDRIEAHLAGETAPEDAAALRAAIEAAGGNSAALDAIEAIWNSHGRRVAAGVDCDAAWTVLARRLGLPYPTDDGPRRRWRSVPEALVALTVGIWTVAWRRVPTGDTRGGRSVLNTH